MVSGFGISIPERDAHIYMLSKNSVTIYMPRAKALNNKQIKNISSNFYPSRDLSKVSTAKNYTIW